MGDFVEKLRLKELAEEDVYFAKRDVELLEALHRKEAATLAKCGGEGKKRPDAFERRLASPTARNKKRILKLVCSYRDLLNEFKNLCKSRGK